MWFNFHAQIQVNGYSYMFVICNCVENLAVHSKLVLSWFIGIKQLLLFVNIIPAGMHYSIFDCSKKAIFTCWSWMIIPPSGARLVPLGEHYSNIWLFNMVSIVMTHSTWSCLGGTRAHPSLPLAAPLLPLIFLLLHTRTHTHTHKCAFIFF